MYLVQSSFKLIYSKAFLILSSNLNLKSVYGIEIPLNSFGPNCTEQRDNKQKIMTKKEPNTVRIF